MRKIEAVVKKGGRDKGKEQTDRQTEERPTEVRDARGVSVKRSPHPSPEAFLLRSILCVASDI